MKNILLVSTLFVSAFSFAQSKVYAGEAYQAAADALFNVELTITKDKKYLINYTPEGCSGELKFIKEDELGFLYFKEKITKGKDVCQDGLNVYLIYTDEDKKTLNFKAEATEEEDDFFRTLGDLTLKENQK